MDRCRRPRGPFPERPARSGGTRARVAPSLEGRAMIRRGTLLVLMTLVWGAAAGALESHDPALLAEMRWRMIGPHRGGRTKAAAGIPDRPNVFYVGAVNGG